MELIRVAASPQAMLNGAVVSPQGRVFSSFPRWTPVPSPSVAEAQPDGSYQPFPGDAWNDWKPGDPHENAIVNAHAVYCDDENHLWVIDDAAPRICPPVAGAIKLVRFDLSTNRLKRVYRFDRHFLPPGSILGHMRADGKHAYITESHHDACIVVMDLATGRAWKRLAGHPLMLAAPGIVPVIQGREFKAVGGGVPQVHVDLLDLSPDRKWLYFATLLGPMLRRVETRWLTDESVSDEELAKKVEDVIPVPPLAGLAFDKSGNLYICSFTQDAILRLPAGGKKLETLITDRRISFPNEGAVGPDGYFYFPSSQIHRSGRFGDGTEIYERPFEVFKIKVG